MGLRTDSEWIPEPGTVLDGRYRLDKMVDRGGMGVIMRGQHIRMKREVAVKLLSPDIASEAGYRARFQREVDLAATLEHPNIVRCYDFGETEDGLLYLVMEMLDGASLKKVIEEEGRFRLRRAAGIALQLLDGLAAAHLQDVVHRDLKPGNVFVVKNLRGKEVVKVLDFGLAKSLSSDNIRITKTGAICGTASYLAPESLVTQESTKSGDIYACGLIMLEMLLGRKVFASWSMAQTFLQQLMVPARIPRRVWETPFGRLMRDMLQKHPHDRPKDAEVVFQELRGFIGDLPDFRLEKEELPPPPGDDLGDDLLRLLAEGKYQDLETLRHLPAPESWESEALAPDYGTTERILLSELKEFVEAQRPTTRFDQQPTVRDRPAVTPGAGARTVRFDEQPTVQERPAVNLEASAPAARSDEHPTVPERPAVTPRIGELESPPTEKQTVRVGAVPKAKQTSSATKAEALDAPDDPSPKVIVEQGLETTEAAAPSAPVAVRTSAASTSSPEIEASRPEKMHFPLSLVVAGVSVGVVLGLLGIWAFARPDSPPAEPTPVAAPATPTVVPEAADDNEKSREVAEETNTFVDDEPEPVEEDGAEIAEPAPPAARSPKRKPKTAKKKSTVSEEPQLEASEESGKDPDSGKRPRKFAPNSSKDDKAEKILDDVLRLPDRNVGTAK